MKILVLYEYPPSPGGAETCAGNPGRVHATLCKASRLKESLSPWFASPLFWRGPRTRQTTSMVTQESQLGAQALHLIEQIEHGLDPG